MDILLTVIVIAVIVVIVWAIAKFVLRLTARVIGCVLTILIALGIVALGLVILL